jgi:hypothetical protein
VGGRAAGLEAPALVDGDVDDHAARRIAAIISRLTSLGALAPGTRTAPITTSASAT